MRRNEDIRAAAKTAGVKLWEIAEALGVGDYTLSRRLRYEMDEGEREKILAIIERIRKEKNDDNEKL